MSQFLKLSLAIVAVSFCSFAATTATQTFTLGQTTESFSQNFSFAKFDPSLGNLVGIHFSISASEVGNASVTNGSMTSGTYTYNNLADISITDVNEVIYNETLPGTMQSATIGPGATVTFTGVKASSSAEAEYTGNGAGTFNLTTYTGNGSPSTSINGGAFIGTGTLALSLNGDDVSFCTGASVSCNTSGTAGGSVSLYYNYSVSTPPATIPEPATMGLLGSALLGLGLIKTRRRKD